MHETNSRHLVSMVFGQEMWIIKRRRLSIVTPMLVLFSVFVLFEAATQANAQSRAQICHGLTQQLNALSDSRASGGNSAKYRQFDAAVRNQTGQISKAKRAMRRSGCVGLFKNTKSQCRAINKSLKKMQANLSSLKRQRNKFAPKRANSSNKRRQILASLRRNRCDTLGLNDTRQARADTKPKSKRRTILEQVFGVSAYDENGNRKKNNSVSGDSRIASRYGTFRTLCVRKTDGYYFPISFSTVKDRFNEDEQVCQAMCPGSDVGLYHHKMPNEDSEDMISFATKTAYRDEPFAFAYRKAHNPDNRCRFSTAGLNQSVDTAPTGDLTPVTKTIRIGVPVFRKDQSLSPDSYDTAVEGLNADSVKNYIASVEENKDAPTEQLIAENRNVRIVGPAFFPVQ